MYALEKGNYVVAKSANHTMKWMLYHLNYILISAELSENGMLIGMLNMKKCLQDEALIVNYATNYSQHNNGHVCRVVTTPHNNELPENRNSLFDDSWQSVLHESLFACLSSPSDYFFFFFLMARWQKHCFNLSQHEGLQLWNEKWEQNKHVGKDALLTGPSWWIFVDELMIK